TVVTEVLFRGASTEVAGVRYLRGRNLYRAHAQCSNGQGQPGEVFCDREVILSAGAFNTPQILMLSGIGPAEELNKHNIDVRVDSPGVGTNLQDRYEVGVVWKMRKDFSVLSRLKFRPDADDEALRQWHAQHDGLYATNGVLLSILRKSRPDL